MRVPNSKMQLDQPDSRSLMPPRLLRQRCGGLNGLVSRQKRLPYEITLGLGTSRIDAAIGGLML